MGKTQTGLAHFAGIIYENAMDFYEKVQHKQLVEKRSHFLAKKVKKGLDFEDYAW